MNDYFAPINIRFFQNKDNYISDYLESIESSQQLTILIYVLSQCYYRSKTSKTDTIRISCKFGAKTCFLKNLKQSTAQTIKVIESLENTLYIKSVVVEGEEIVIQFSLALMTMLDKSQRFSICLNDLLRFKYIEHSIVYLLTRFGKKKSYIYHNYLCHILHLESLTLPRQKQKIKRIFKRLEKLGIIKESDYKDYKYIFSRE